MTLHHIAGPTPKPTAHSSSGDVGKLYLTVIATATSDGDITFSFPSVPPGTIQIGSFNCPSAPYTAQFTLTNNGPEISSWQSSNNPGATRSDPGDQLTINGTGLVAATDYAMNYSGYQTTSGVAPQVVPESHTDVVISTNQGGLETIVWNLASGSQILPAPEAGFAYRIHAVHLLNSGIAATAAGAVEILWQTGLASPHNEGGVYMKGYKTGDLAESSFFLNGLLAAGPVVGSFGSGYINMYVWLNYDLIQI